MKYSITITIEEELQNVWQDSRISFMYFSYNEKSLEECIQIGPESYEATYDSIVITEPMSFTWYDVNNSITVTEQVNPGEYGIKPNSRRA